MGLFSSSKSVAQNTTNTQNTDSRTASEGEAIALHSFNGNDLHIETSDGDLLRDMLASNERVFMSLSDTVKSTQENNSLVLQSGQAQQAELLNKQSEIFKTVTENEQPNDLNKTMIYAGVASIAVLAFMLKGKF